MNNKLILCVDDDADILESLTVVLEDDDYVVVTALDGQEGFEVFQKHHNELCGILTDAVMPNLDGLGFSNKVRSTGSKIPIILVTAFLAKEPGEKGAKGVSVKEYHDAGIDGHIEKPFQVDDLLKAIHLCFDPYGKKSADE